ncbi:MAG TPA: putative glycolipid-binding domain-containing protein [Jiangellaceae bacterium]
MNRELVWTAERWPGIEHASVHSSDDGVTVDSVVVAGLDDGPVRLHYRLDCDIAWHPRHLVIQVYGHPDIRLSNTDNRWHGDDGTPFPDLDGCTDVDIALTPFTNTIPIRRLRLDHRESADLDVIYIHPASTVEISRKRQRYTRTDAGFRYESGDFRADLQVDEDGFVTNYPRLWTLLG